MTPLEIYLLNVGQADTSIIRTPSDNVILIDAVKPKKIRNVINEIRPDGKIAHLIITHPHIDHYSAVSSVLANFDVGKVTLAPFWHESGSAGYHQIINKLSELNIPIRFISGYERIYPDGGTYPDYAGQPVFELLGPSNNIIEELAENKALNPNHLSIITRLTFGKFCMIIAADAQMDNWAHFDQEGMLDRKCDVLRAAHHGSKNGSQWERLDRLRPRMVIVSSDPKGHHHIPDLIGIATFIEYIRVTGKKVALTRDTGSIKIEIPDPDINAFEVTAYGEGAKDNVFPGQAGDLAITDWHGLLQDQIY